MDDATTLLGWIKDQETLNGEVVTHVFLEEYEGDEPLPRRLLTRDEFTRDKWATEEFDAGLGGAGCPSLVAWMPSWVLYTHEYDGSTSLFRLPRHPVVAPDPIYYGDTNTY